MKFRTSNTRVRCALDFDDESLTRQEFEAESNINNILAKFKVTGVLVDPQIRATRYPVFGDFSQVPDFAGFHDIMLGVKTSFDDLPFEVRMRFGNDPAEAMKWLATNPSTEAIVDVFSSSQHKTAPSGAVIGGGAAVAEDPLSSTDPSAVVPSDSPHVSTT